MRRGERSTSRTTSSILTEAGVVVTQTLFDSGARRAELNRQASRVDGASFRVLERSEFIALAVVQDYLEYHAAGVDRRDRRRTIWRFHQSILGDIRAASRAAR